MNKELELYLHIPFCKSKCKYCDFLSAPAQEDVKIFYVETLLKEIRQKSYIYKDYKVTSIFFGGGTPSILERNEIKKIMKVMYQEFTIEKDAEITIEANPGTLTYEKLNEYVMSGINRLSLGLQSTYNEELVLLGRIHTFEEFEENYDLARACGFRNINIDLMSALPRQTLETWKHTLKRIINLNPEHISAYSLIIEEGTPFFIQYQEDCKRREKGEKPIILPSEETERNMYYLTKKLLSQAGFQRYEISNYSKPGKECRHNIGYWTDKFYLGLGLGAASYIEGTRFSNTSILSNYLETDFKAYDVVELTSKESMEEFMFLGLRMICGVSMNKFYNKFHRSMEEIYGDVIQELQKDGLIQLLLKQGEKIIKLTEIGLDVSNYVLSRFIIE
ncbi:oxygen-independent coproporphyrinogen III oxidase [Anaerosacchariphilus polymeriproducens]|uniref:Heme chaperone HemW n=1 Tax=Anaerosacchariphilus polymeriproducens TaxID=1812858 RepID=A0A371ASX5_9FIRM|nr:oxygen-independent coproporphyrinogen III oxidase [Anaerosacchariphilus polymeriproducens]